jgi:beta-galactosidase
VRRPTLWDVDRPYLYTLSTEFVVHGAVVAGTSPGSASATPASTSAAALSLNGRYLEIYGVNLHHDQGALGSVVRRAGK